MDLKLWMITVLAFTAFTAFVGLASAAETNNETSIDKAGRGLNHYKNKYLILFFILATLVNF